MLSLMGRGLPLNQEMDGWMDDDDDDDDDHDDDDDADDDDADV